MSTPKNEISHNRSGLPYFLLYLACIIYAVVRYVAFSPQNFQHLPVFVLNKAFSMGAALCFAIAFWYQWRGTAILNNGTDPSGWFRSGVFGSVAHVPMSLAILNPSYFKAFFINDRMTFIGEAVFLFGALTLAGIYFLTRPSWSLRHRWWISLGTISMLFCHTLCMGIARGFNMNRSYAYLPPMWLISLIGTTLGAVFLLLSRPISQDPPQKS